MKCPDAGTLQAYLDSELPEARTSRAAGHLEACASCRDRLGRMEAAAGRVNAWLDALAPEDPPAVYEGVRRIAVRTGSLRWRWAALGLAGALAASVALYVANAPVPQKKALVQKVEGPLADARGSVSVVPHRVATVRKRMRRPIPQPTLDDFVPFDDADPMQIGMVVRVMLPMSDTSEIATDLVIGEDGRARAFRFVQ